MENSCDFHLSAEILVHAYLVQCAKSENSFAFSTDGNIGMVSNKRLTVNVSHVPYSSAYGSRLRD